MYTVQSSAVTDLGDTQFGTIRRYARATLHELEFPNIPSCTHTHTLAQALAPPCNCVCIDYLWSRSKITLHKVVVLLSDSAATVYSTRSLH